MDSYLLIPIALAQLNLEFVLVWLQAVEQGFESLLREYNQVRDDVAQGLGFYGQLQEAVKTLHQEVGDYCLARSVPLPSALLPYLEGVVDLEKPCLMLKSS